MENLEEYLKVRRQFWPYEGRYKVCRFGKNGFMAKIDTVLAGLVWAEEVSSSEARIRMTLKKEFGEYGIGTELLWREMEFLRNAGYNTVRYELDSQYYAVQIYEYLGFGIKYKASGKIGLIWRR